MANEYYLKHPKDQLLYKLLAWTMCIIGLNSQHWQWYPMPTHKLFLLQRGMVLIFGPITVISEILYLCAHYKEHEFSALATMFSIIPLSLTICIKLFLAQTPAYKTVMTDFMDKIHLHNYFHTFEYNFVMKTLLTAERQFRKTLYYLMSLCYVSYTSWQIIPIIDNIRNNPDLNNVTSRLEICTHIWLPFDYEFDFYVWVPVQIIMMYVGFIGITDLLCFDSINLAFAYHLTGHIKIMKRLLTTGFNDDMTQEDIKEKLVEITKYYQFIRDTFKKVEAAFGLNIAGIYGLNLIMGGILLYQLMTFGKNTDILLTYGLMIPLYMGMLVIMSLVLENVRIQADDIPDLVYMLRWESMSISNQKLWLMILLQVQPTLEFRASFNLKTGVQPAIDIIKTTFSYYVMIKSRM